jgi:hypothetical protein
LDQVETLDAFYVTDCAGGTATVQTTHPRTGVAVNLLFSPEAPPAYSFDGAGFWWATLSFLVLP